MDNYTIINVVFNKYEITNNYELVKTIIKMKINNSSSLLSVLIHLHLKIRINR